MIGFTELRAQAWKYGCIALAVLAVAALVGMVVFRSSAAVAGLRATAATHEAQQAVAEAQGLRQALVAEHAKATALNVIADQNEQDKIHAEQTAAELADDLRAERVKLRDRWTCAASVPGASASPGQPDASADDRAASASRIVRAAIDADNQIRALQAVAEADRK